MPEQLKRIIAAFVLSAAVLFGWFFFVEKDRRIERSLALQQAQELARASQSNTQQVTEGVLNSNAEQQISQVLSGNPDRDYANLGKTITMDSNLLRLGISLNNGRFYDATLLNYSEDLSNKEVQVKLLNYDPNAMSFVSFIEADFISRILETGAQSDKEQVASNQLIDLLRNDSWVVVEEKSTSLEQPNLKNMLVLRKASKDKTYIVNRTITIDDKYLVTLTDEVTNLVNTDLEINQFARVYFSGTVERKYTYVHYGGVVSYEKGLKEITYPRIAKRKEIDDVSGNLNWLGFTNRYWLTALIPAKSDSIKQSTFKHLGGDSYQAAFLGKPIILPAGESYIFKTDLYIGAKEYEALLAYQNQGVAKYLDRSLDVGAFYLISYIILRILHFVQDFVGNFGLAIIFMTIIVRLPLLPLAQKSFKEMIKMRKIQPELSELKQRYGGNPQEMRLKLAELYRKNKINMIAGCIPLIIQIPIFFALYSVLIADISMRHAKFFGWIQDLSAPDPTSLWNLFGLLPYDVPQTVAFGVLPMVMLGTMLLQHKLNPQPTDPIQAKIAKFYPWFFSLIMSNFASGLLLYWITNNTLSVIHQGLLYYLHRDDLKELKK